MPDSENSVQDRQLPEAVDALRSGGVIAYPTEAVWGLGCDPLNREAFNRLLNLKRRPLEKGVILVASCEEQLGLLLEGLNARQLQLLRTEQERPTTWLIPSNGHMPDWITGQHTTVAVRISRHAIVYSLCEAFGGMIVSTSANTAGCSPATSEQAARNIFHNQVDVYVAGKLGGQEVPSRIIDLQTGTVLR